MGLAVAGIDIGSVSCETVILIDRRVIAFNILPTGSSSRAAAEKSFEDALEKAGLKREDIAQVVATGYGRISVPFANRQVTEISCHAKGANFVNRNVRTVIDIGGQDSKAIRLDDRGNATDFAMNDKCAAGTGRFLEVMAAALEISLDKMGKMALASRKPVKISSTCTVFAESEVVSLVAEGAHIEDIAAGITKAIAEKVGSLVLKVGIEEVVALTGGVAKNPGIRTSLEKALGVKLFVPDEPQIIGALGAALFAWESVVSAT